MHAGEVARADRGDLLASPNAACRTKGPVLTRLRRGHHPVTGKVVDAPHGDSAARSWPGRRRLSIIEINNSAGETTDTMKGPRHPFVDATCDLHHALMITKHLDTRQAWDNSYCDPLEKVKTTLGKIHLKTAAYHG